MTRVTEIMILLLSSDQLQILADHVVQKGCLPILGGVPELGLDIHIIL